MVMRHEKKASATGILCPGRCCLLQVGQIMLYGCVKINLFSVHSMDSFIVRQGIMYLCGYYFSILWMQLLGIAGLIRDVLS